MTIVSIKQDKESKVLTIKAVLGGTTNQLVPDEEVDFEVDDGSRELTLDMISDSTGNTDFRLDFTKAERPNGNDYIKDIGHHGYWNRLKLHVPRKQ